MNKFKALLLALCVSGLVSTVNAAGPAGRNSLIGGSDSQFFTHVGVSSVTVITGAGTLWQIDMSTGNGLDFLVAFDSSVIASNSYANFADATRMTPALIFSSAVVLTAGSNSVTGNKWTAPQNGVRFTNGLFIFKSAASSGDANRATVYWSR